MKLTITLPGPPVGKGRPRFTRTGHAYTPAKTRSYESALRHEAALAMGMNQPMLEAVAVDVVAVFPVPESWSRAKRSNAFAGEFRSNIRVDADNILKSLDAFNGIVWADDKQIVQATIAKRYGQQPCLSVMVWAI